MLLVLNRSPGANIIETVDRVRDMLPTLQKMIPAAISMDVMMDRTPTIRASLREVEHTLMISGGAGDHGGVPVPAQCARDIHSEAWRCRSR
ncbi:efflux RND transporter permease subunit [Cupriavidus basilensis]